MTHRAVFGRRSRYAVVTAVLSFASLAVAAPLAVAGPLECHPRESLATGCDRADAAVVLRHEAGSRWRVIASLGGNGQELVGRTAEIPRIDPADRHVVLVRRERGGAWEPPTAVSENAARFLDARARYTPDVRLAFAARYVGDRDPLIAEVCLADLAAAEFDAIALHADRLPRARLEDRLRNGSVRPCDLKLHGILLGLCGTSETTTLCESIATEPVAHCDIGVGHEGLWIAVLLADYARGPERLAAAVGPGEDCETRIRAVLDAADWVRTHAPRRVDRDRLVKVAVSAAMTPEGRDLAAATLSDWGAWDAAERLATVYGTGTDRDSDLDRAGRIAMLRYLRRALDEPRGLAPGAHAKVASTVRRIERTEPDIARRATILSGRRAAVREVF